MSTSPKASCPDGSEGSIKPVSGVPTAAAPLEWACCGGNDGGVAGSDVAAAAVVDNGEDAEVSGGRGADLRSEN